MNAARHTDSDDPRKRVLLMVSSMRGGGSERQVLLLAQSLDRSRFRPYLYLTEAAGRFMNQVPSDVQVVSFDPQPERGGIYLPGRQLRRQTDFVRSVIESQKIDVVYERTFQMTLLAGNAAAGVRRVATIVSPPDLAVPLVEKRFVWLKKRRLASAYRNADCVVAVSRAAAESAESFYDLPRGSVEVIRNAIDVDAVAKRDDPVPVVSRGSTTVVCVGRMTEEKGHRDLVDALGHVRANWPESRGPLRVRLIGDGPGRAALQHHVRSLGLEPLVEFVGESDSALDEIAAADALVLPSRFEGMPNVVLEAMALGTPVIATRSGGTAELQDDDATAFWASPANPDSIAQAMVDFACSPERAAQQAAAANRLVRTRHDLGQTVRRIEDLLDPPQSSARSDLRR